MSKPLRELADVYYGKSPNEIVSDESVIPIIGTGGVYGRATRAMYQGPAVVVPRKGSLGNPQFIGEPFWPADTTYAVLPKPKVDAKWLYYSLAAFDLTKLNEATGVPSINRDWLYRIKLGSDEFDGQRRIAEILSTVDEAIEQTEALIAKYQQIKAGLMHDLFTRGVTPDGHLRPTRGQASQLYKKSPLGWIVKEWEVDPLDSVADVVDPNPSHRNPVYVSDGFPFISTIEFIEPDDVEVNTPRRVAEATVQEQESRCYFCAGSIAFSRKGTIGAIRMLPSGIRFALLDSLCVINPRNDMSSHFLLHTLRSFHLKRQIANSTMGVALQQVSIGRVRKLLIPIPKAKERDAIQRCLENISTMIAVEMQKGTKLHGQKHGLMQDLLTGHVRVKVAESAST
jgi:type I restriction enzyme, S subunit